MKQKIKISGPMLSVLLVAALGGWHFLETRRGAVTSGDFWLCDLYIGLFAAAGVFLALFILFVIIVAWTRYVSLGSVVVACLLPVTIQGYCKVFVGAPMHGLTSLATIIIAILIVWCPCTA